MCEAIYSKDGGPTCVIDDDFLWRVFFLFESGEFRFNAGELEELKN